MSSDDPGTDRDDLISHIEIAWARAVARAVCDPLFAERLKHYPLETLESLGTTIPAGFTKDDLRPSPEGLERAIERYRAAQANAADAAARTAGPGVTPYSMSAHTGCIGPASYSMSAPYRGAPTVIGMSAPSMSHGGMSYPYVCTHLACYSMSGISSSPSPVREAPPQWIGTRPSTGGA